jgi:type IV pilus assembly protein PilB
MPISEQIRQGILRGASTDEIRKMTLDEGVKTIRMSGITKVCQGITTLKEIEGVSIAE